MKTWLSGFTLAAALLLIAGTAHATSYTCNESGNPPPASVSGDAIITEPGTCTLTTNVTATGQISITAGSTVSTLNLTANGGDLAITASSNSITTGNLSTNTALTLTASNTGATITTGDASATGGDLDIDAYGDITTNALTTTAGNINVVSSEGDVTANDDIMSSEDTTLRGNDVTTMDITSDWGIQVTALSGTLDLGDLISNDNDSSFGGNVLLSASGNLQVGDITNNGNATTGGIEIHANTGGTSTVFNIGGGGSNGTGTLDVSTDTGGGTDEDYIPGGIYVTNGTDGSTGGIQVNSMGDLVLTSTASRSALLILQAYDGTITLPSGSLTADGPAGYGAGQIVLLGNTVATDDGTVITASQTTGADGTDHGVSIAAQTITVTGSGLAVHGDGNGVTGDAGSAFALLMPEGGITVTSSGDLNSIYWTVAYNDFFSYDGSLTVSGSAPLVVTANGSYSEVAATAYPLDFENGAVTLQSTGATDNQVQIGYDGTLTGTSGLVFSGDGDVLIDASGVGGNGGTAQIYTDQASISTTSFTMKANGPSSGNGNGGQVTFEPSQATVDVDTNFTLQANGAAAGTGSGGNVYSYMSSESISGSNFTVQANGASGGDGDGGTAFVYTYPDTLTIDDGTTATIQANASSDGTGNAQPAAVTFYPGDADFNVGSGAGEFAFAARGGSTGGNGGGLFIEGYSSAVTVYGAGAMTSPLDVSAPGSTGDGGQIYLTAYNGLTFDGDDSVLTADSGTTSGNGGLIQIQTSVNPVVIGTGGDGDVTLTATGQGTNGNGGTVSVQSYDGITADTTCISVTAAGDGTGGTITLNAEYGGLTLDGDLDASSQGMGNGAGGQINLTGGYIYLADDVNTTLTADSNGSGDAGSISITTNFGDVTVSSDDDALSLEAMSNGSGNGGTVTINSAGDADLDGSYINVAAGTDSGATGGDISVTATGDITATDSLDATGGCDSGAGGSVTVDGNNVSISSIDADAGGNSCPAFSGAKPSLLPRTSGSGNGGYVLVQAAGTNVIVSGTITVDATGAGTGGTVSVTPTDGAGTLTMTGVTISASGDPAGSGNGNNITINAAGTVAMSGTTLKSDGGLTGNGQTIALTANAITVSSDAVSNLFARGGANSGSESASGNGGTINITVNGSSPLQMSNNNSIAIAANGVGNGTGGSVTISSAGVPAGTMAVRNHIDVNQLINVSGAGSGASSNDGSINLNSVPCQQVIGSGPSWPASYWNCTGASTGVSDMLSGATSLVTQIYVLNVLNSANFNSTSVPLYLFTNISGWNSFFATNPTISGATEGGITFTDKTVTPWFIAASVFTSGNSQISASTQHEAGHAIDSAWGGASANNFGTALTADTTPGSTFMSTDCSTVFAGTGITCTPSIDNWTIFQNSFFPMAPGGVVSPAEMFALIFEHKEGHAYNNPIYSNIQSVLGYFSNSNSYMGIAISSATH